MSILYEATSPRADHGIWVLTYGQPSRTPFNFDWKGKTRGGKLINFVISTNCKVVFHIKEYIDEDPIIAKTVQMGENNSVMFELSYEDMMLLKMENKYHLTATLYDENDKLIRILLRDLPIKILESGVENNG